MPVTHPDFALAEAVQQYRNNPLGYVGFAFPWGKKGTFLEHHQGPCPCQIKILNLLGRELGEREALAAAGKTSAIKPIRIGVASGHGIGKSSLFGMLDNFIRSTRPLCRGTVTANTFQQLSTKTWAAIQAWNKISLTGKWFEITTELAYYKAAKSEWFSSAQTCGEDNSEAFAGQHSPSCSYYINDECSGVPDKIFEVEEGGLTDAYPSIPIQFAFGNLTRPLGKFARIMAGHERGWLTIRVDSRDCPLTNKEQIQEWIDEYGEDSDFVRVRVRGLPPRAAAAQFISDDLVTDAQKRIIHPLLDDPLICGVDFAWGGDDKNCIRFRCGLDAKSIPPIHIPGEHTRTPEIMVSRLSDILSKTYNGRKVAMMFMDSAGIAGPVAMRLRQLGYPNVIEVNFGAHSPNAKYKNVRSYMWGELKQWLERGAIDRSTDLFADLTAPEVLKHVPLLLEPKDAISKRIGRSTDDGDALALTFYMPVSPEGVKKDRMNRERRYAQTTTEWS